MATSLSKHHEVTGRDLPLNDAKCMPEQIINIDNRRLVCATDETEIQTHSSDSSVFSSINSLQEHIGQFIENNKWKLRLLFTLALCGFALGYFIWALVISVIHHCQSPVPLVALTCVILACIGIWYVRSKFGESIAKCTGSIQMCLQGTPSKVIQIVVAVLGLGGILVTIALTIWKRPTNAWALGGMLAFLCVIWVFSAHPRKVKWRPVIMGMVLQFYFAIIILKWETGYQMLFWLGQCMQKFLGFADYGSEFVFGEKFVDHIFAMKVLPVVVFFSCAVNILYHIGAMQILISKIGWLFNKVLRTTAPESLCMAANIFVGMTEAPIVIRPFLNKMTKSELTAIMTGGFATIAGSVLAAYISFGVPPVHLLCASVMNAPCALAVSKLLYPETEESQFEDGLVRALDEVEQEDAAERKDQNIIAAAASGASASVKLVANIAVNLIAFLSILALINAILSWLGGFLCYPELSFQVICSYVFRPVAFLMGVEWADTAKVAELIGIKTFLNEFVAYSELSKVMDARIKCAAVGLSVRSEVIATYALCGFSNIGSIGVTLGGLGPMMERSKRGMLAKLVLRALFGGVVTCLLTASVAGLLITEYDENTCGSLITNGTLINGTLPGNMSEGMVSTMMYAVNLTDTPAFIRNTSPN